MEEARKNGYDGRTHNVCGFSDNVYKMEIFFFSLMGLLEKSKKISSTLFVHKLQRQKL